MRRSRERGAALLVSMVMVFMLTILGIASMQGATLENTLAANSIQKDTTFQAAESATDMALSMPNAVESVICSPATTTTASALSKSAAQDTHYTLEYGGRAVPVGYSLGGPIGARRFVVTGTSEIPDSHTRTSVSQGVVVIGASDSSGDC